MDNATFANATNGTNGTFDGFQSNSTPKSFWAGLTLPVLYLVILVGSLATFSSLYRKRQVAKAAKLESWFGAHRSRDIYLSLLHLDPADASNDEKQLKKVPDSILKAALLRRALEDIQRIVILRTSKQALQSLLQRGSVGDELWQRFQRAEQEMELEIKDVVAEADAFTPGWGQVIFQSANEMNQNRLLKERVDEFQDKVDAEREWWDRKRSQTQSEFLKELGAEEDASETATKKSVSDDDTVLVDADGPAQAQGGSKKKSKKK